VREFGAFTPDLAALADWLTACGIRTVAMESTGVYWIPLFEVLEERGFDVKLVDARQLKRVPGRKTDVVDCQWLQQLHSYGLLAPAFRPDDQVCVLRSYFRQRAVLVRYAGQHVQHMQKALIQMNVQLQHVLADITGATGMRIIRAILAGERDPQHLAALRDPQCKQPVEVIAKALQGTWRKEHLVALQQAVELVDTYQAQIAACDAQIAAQLASFDDRSDGEPPPKGRRPRKDRHDLGFDATGAAFRLVGVDLTAVPGLDAHTVLKVLSETGRDLTRWRTPKQFASWLGVAPNNRVSGGKLLSQHTTPSANRAAAALRVAAQSLHHSHTALGAFLRHIASRHGMPQAITATAHKLALILYRLVHDRCPYVEAGEDAFERRYRERVLQQLTRRAHRLGFTLIPHQEATPLPTHP
jgi:transposase